MIGYYADLLFFSRPELFLQSVDFLLKGIAAEEREKAFALQCADSLRSIVDSAGLVERLKGVVNELIPTICGLVERQREINVFDVVSTVVSNYAESIGDNVGEIARSLMRRVDADYGIMARAGKKTSLAISQCINVFVDICQHKGLALRCEDSICRLTQYISLVEGIEFEDEIFGVLAEYMHTTQSVPAVLYELLPHLQSMFQKHKAISGSFFRTLNYLIVYGQEQLVSRKECVEKLTTLAAMAMTTREYPQEISNFKGCLLVQLLLQAFGPIRMMDGCMSALALQAAGALEAKAALQDFVRLELLNVLICAMCVDTDLCFNALEEKKIEYFVTEISKADPLAYEHAYDSKVLTLGLCALLTRSQTDPDVDELTPLILRTAIAVLHHRSELDREAQEQVWDSSSGGEDPVPSAKLETKEAKPLEEALCDMDLGYRLVFAKLCRDSEEESESGSEDDNSETEGDYAVARKTLNQLESPVKRADEFAVFGETMKQIRTKDERRYEEMMKTLSAREAKEYKTLLQSKRVSSGSATVARKILKPKRASK